MHSVFTLLFAVIVALTLVYVPPPVLAQAPMKRSLGETVSEEWMILACHPATEELTLSSQYAFGAAYGFAQPVRMKAGDSVYLSWPQHPAKRATLEKFTHPCTGVFKLW